MCNVIKWENISHSDGLLITAIAKRACEIAKENGVTIDLLSMEMDISACHLSNPLRLTDLLNADGGNFGHDD